MRPDRKQLIVSAALTAVFIDATRIPVYAWYNHYYLYQNALLLFLIILAAILGNILGNKLLPQVSYPLF